MENLGTHELRTMVTEAADEAVNIGYRVGDTLHRWRERRAIAQGQEPIIVPSEGYGRVATGAKNGWVRILARALYKTEAFEKLLYVVEGTQDTDNPMRGWRAFTSIAMSDAPVTIIIAGRTYEVRTDRGGVLDVKLDIDLPAGLHEVIMYVPGSRAAVRNGYPRGTFLLTDWGPTPDRWFRSGTQHKVQSLRRLAHEFPEMQWILIGDDGQRDPDIYNGFAVRYPQNVAAIMIRNLTVGETVLASGRVWGDKRAQQMTQSPLWMEANDGDTLSRKLRQRGLL